MIAPVSLLCFFHYTDNNNLLFKFTKERRGLPLPRLAPVQVANFSGWQKMMIDDFKMRSQNFNRAATLLVDRFFTLFYKKDYNGPIVFSFRFKFHFN